MAIDDEVVTEVVRRVLRVCSPERIILFGSAATDRMTSDSDIDLLIVERDPGDVLARATRVLQALRGIRYPVDVVVMAADRFAETRDVIGGLAYPASRHGRAIYEAA